MAVVATFGNMPDDIGMMTLAGSRKSFEKVWGSFTLDGQHQWNESGFQRSEADKTVHFIVNQVC